MTVHAQLAITPRDRFLQAAEKELVAFERREREFLKGIAKSELQSCRFPSLRSRLTIRPKGGRPWRASKRKPRHKRKPRLGEAGLSEGASEVGDLKYRSCRRAEGSKKSNAP